MATLRDVAVRALADGPLAIPELTQAIQELVPSAIVWDEGVRHMLEGGNGLFTKLDGDRWALSHAAESEASTPDREQFEDVATRTTDESGPINRLGLVGEDATDYVRHQILATQPHTVHEQRELARRRDLALAVGDERGADQICWSLAWGSMRLGMWVADKFRPVGMEACDLILVSIQGLFRAAKKWDPALGAFSTYATWWARQAVQRSLAESSRLIQIPVHAHDAWLNIRRFVRNYLDLHEEEPSAAEIADSLSLSRALVDGVLLASHDPIDIDLLYEAHVVVDEWLDDPLAAFYQERGWNRALSFSRARSLLAASDVVEDTPEPEGEWDRKAMVTDALSRLDSRSRDIVLRRFGFNDADEETLEEIGGSLGLSRERIRQIEAKAFDHLAPILSRWLGRATPPPRRKAKGKSNGIAAGEVAS